MGNVHVVVGGQWGSEAKGHVSAQIARLGDAARNSVCPSPPDPVYWARKWAAVRVAGPNAGHSAIGTNGQKYALSQIPVVAVTNPHARLVIGPGSEVSPNLLNAEIKMLEDDGYPIRDRLIIDNQATILERQHAQREQTIGMDRHGSTSKGVGAARADRILRKAHLYGDHADDGLDTAAILHDWLAAGNHVLIEGTQGYGLGLHAGYYPYCTSSDCRATDFLAMAGICPWWQAIDEVLPWVVLRTYPIRIAGNSGPLQHETTWEALADATGGHIQPEFTTVTKKLRRVGHWEPDLARAAVHANGGREALVALTFLDYWYPETAGATDENALTPQIRDHLAQVEKELDAPIALATTGPDTAIDFRIGKQLGEG